MTLKIANLTLRKTKTLLFREKCLHLRKFGSRRPYNVLFFGSDIIGLNSLRRINNLK